VNIGETLARARQEAGLTITQVSARTRIRETVVRAIERNDFSVCGGNFYARGHIRGVARAVGVDAEPLVAEYDETHGGAPQAVSAMQAFEPSTPVSFAERRSPNWGAAMVIALVLVVAYGVIRVVGVDDNKSVGATGSQVDAPQASATAGRRSPDAVGQAPATRAPEPREEVTVRVRARRDSWLNVRNEKGKLLFSGIVRQGSTREWTAKKRIRLLIGYPRGIVLTVNGKNLGSPRQDPGRRVTIRSYDLDDPKKE